jgi:transcription antitermination factor NusG
VNNTCEFSDCAELLPATPDVHWFAIHTRSRHEKLVSFLLQARGIDQYLPTVTEVHRWSDRHKKLELPLFPGYVFVRLADSNERRVEVLRVPGVVGFVGLHQQGTAIPEDQIEGVKTLMAQNVPWAAHPFLKEGQRVRIRGGALEGMEGIFLRRNGKESLIISIDVIQRSLAVCIQGYDLQVLRA